MSALLLAVALPLLAALTTVLFGRLPNLRDGSAILIGIVLAVLLCGLWRDPQAALSLELWQWLPGLTFEFSMEPLGLLFATIAALLWPVTTLYAVGYMRDNDETHQTRFFTCFALAIAAAQWIAFSGNLVTLFFGYEFMTLATWPLVAHKGSAEARQGARTYLVILLTTSIGLLLPAIVWTQLLAGTTEFRAGGILAGKATPGVLAVLYAMFLFGIGKAALMPFHRWLPAAMVAPTPVSALLHAVAVVKAGVFSVLKVTVLIFGLDELAATEASQLMQWVAAFTLLAASIIAITRDNLKSRLAYSTISQLAYIVLAATLANSTAAAGGALHMATHAAGKITLFFCAGAIYTAAHKTLVSQLDGLGRAMPWTFGAFFVASLSIMGLPPLAGTWSKWLLLQGAAEAGEPILLGVLLLGSILSVAYLMPIPIRAFLMPPKAPAGHGEAPWACVVPPCLTALACLVLFFGAEAVIQPLMRSLEQP